MDLVSIIVPIYNAEKYLEECIESILNQTYENIEVILVNDGSTDNSLSICKKYKKNDDRIVILNKINTGVSDSRNEGMKKSSGKYLCFVDSDDTIDNKFVEIMIKELSETGTDVVFCNYMYNYEGKLIKKKPRLKTGVYQIEEIKHKLIDDGTMSGILFGTVWGAIYKRDIIKKNNIEFYREIKYNEDGIFNIEYCLNSKKIRVISDEYLYFYRQTDQSASKKHLKYNRILPATEKIIDIFRKKEFNLNMNLECQLGARKVSEAFWMVLDLCSKNNTDNYKIIKKDLKDLLNKKELCESYKYINTRDINRYKYIYYILMKNKMYSLLYILTRYIYPFLANKISR